MAYRVLFHLDEGASCKVESTLRSVGHLLEELGLEGLDVELVAHGDGITALRRTANPFAHTVRQLAERGVRLAACRNTMTRLGLSAGDLLDVAEIVPSGIGELVRRQAEGWLYVHP